MQKSSILSASEGHFQQLLLPKVSLGQCLASSVFSQHLLKRGWVGGEELLYFCNEGKGEEEEDPLEEKLMAESSPFPNSLQ